MELPEDIRRKIEESHDPETIREVVSRLQSDGVKITDDVLAAIVATIAMTQGIVEYRRPINHSCGNEQLHGGRDVIAHRSRQTKARNMGCF